MSSTFDITYFARNKKQIADIKREFRNSYDEELLAIGINNLNVDNEFVSASMHIDTQEVDSAEYRNDRVKIRAGLQFEDTFTLSINSRNKYFDKDVHFTLFFNEDTRKEIINALENIVVSKDVWSIYTLINCYTIFLRG